MPKSAQKPVSPNGSYWQGTNGSKILKPYFKTRIVGLQSRTRSLKLNYRRSKNGWIKPEVRNSEANRPRCEAKINGF